ncbi:MAG TPA: hypothetical protein VOA88_15890 [Candidatus Dormibacteraeota bacterium]|nr:hypothetical protein [Candidatus Dormibacteraeota bacterium]
MPYNLASQSQLKEWSSRLKGVSPQTAQKIDGEIAKRRTLLAFVGIPSILVLHFLFWIVLLFLYPYFPAVQSVIFWNPLARKVIALGYMDTVFLSLPFARRRLFAPFRDQMFGEILQPGVSEFDRRSYFDKGRVKRVAVAENSIDQIKEELIVEALRQLGARVLLLGASGLGKSSFLRYSLRRKADAKTDIVMYLPALRCSAGVEDAMARRIPMFSQDQDLLKALIYAGRIEVYIDGYNEVDLLTQEKITAFMSLYPHARILVTSQIRLRGLSLIETLELQPLRHDEISEFLAGRELALPETAVVRGNDYRKITEMYLKNLWREISDPAEIRAYETILSNPMDLTTVAIVLGNGKEPNLLSLQEQQFQLMSERYLAQHETAFRTEAFAEDIFQRRVTGDDDLTESPFAREISALITEKMALVRTVEVPGRPPRQEIRFRHDRIRDYVSHFAFLGEEHDGRRVEYAKDDRFLGVYEYLAKVLPLGLAERLREFLLMRAVETQDHRVSDTFILQLSWRQQFASEDPLWMTDFDLPDAKAADLEFDSLQTSRGNLEARMIELKTQMTDSRRRTRLLTQYEDDRLLEGAVLCLLDRGGERLSSVRTSGSGAVMLHSPQNTELILVALGSRTRIDPFQIELLEQRAKLFPRPIVLVTNSQVAVRPNEREADIQADQRERLSRDRIVAVSAVELYELYAKFTQDLELFWAELESKCLSERAARPQIERAD